MDTEKKLSPEASVQFEQGMNLLLSRWTALQMAVQNNWGGPHSNQKPYQLSKDLISLLSQSKQKVYIDEIEDFLDDFMLQLNTEIDDGSIEEIAEKVMIMHEECLEGNYDMIKTLNEAEPPRSLPSCIQQDDSDDDDENNTTDETLSNDDSSAMVVDAPETGSRHSHVGVIDSPQADDGWTVVGGYRRNRGKNN